MPESSVFSEANPAPESKSVAAIFETLVGEGKKFRDQEALAKGKMASDLHIENLELQLEGLRKELETRLTAEEQVAKLLEAGAAKNQEPQVPSAEVDTSITKEDIAKLVRATLDETKSSDQLKSNEEQSNALMKAKFGDKAVEVLKTKALEMGVGTEFLKEVARKSPKAFAATMGLDQPGSNLPSMTKSTVNTAQLASQPFGGNAPQPGTYRHYEEIRRTDTRRYWTPEIQSKLFQDRMAKGDAFYK